MREATPDVVGGPFVAVFLDTIGFREDFLGVRNYANEILLCYTMEVCLRCS
jgi:hypothetical protein